MEIVSAKCERCGLAEECTQEYISKCVQKLLDMRWGRRRSKQGIIEGAAVEEAVKAHKCFCRKLKLNPAVRVAEGMRQLLRRRSGDLSGSSAKRFGRSGTTTQVGDDSSVSNSLF